MQSNNPLKKYSTNKKILMVTMLASGHVNPHLFSRIIRAKSLSEDRIKKLLELQNEFIKELDNIEHDCNYDQYFDEMILEMLDEYL
jgi:hypothetical protein